MNLPNKLTILRIFLVIPFFICLQLGNSNNLMSFNIYFINLNLYKIFAILIFSIASITDFLDGYIARKRNIISDFGKLMDPLADKILVISAFTIFLELGYIDSWMLIIIIFREFLITGIRAIAAAKGEVIPAANSGKYKTTVQIIAVILIIILGKHISSRIVMFFPVIFTVWSGWEYFQNSIKYFKNT